MCSVYLFIVTISKINQSRNYSVCYILLSSLTQLYQSLDCSLEYFHFKQNIKLSVLKKTTNYNMKSNFET